MASEETWGGVVIKGEGPKGMGGGGLFASLVGD